MLRRNLHPSRTTDVHLTRIADHAREPSIQGVQDCERRVRRCPFSVSRGGEVRFADGAGRATSTPSVATAEWGDTRKPYGVYQ